ncbi:Tim10/DDP family zinc finger-domain-containing protein [Mariannaea sp. PMI_226]|nr:Tim10/DDP family zinc finger-domain-containing protein [Mariannaea sp. PMI_226]
MFVAETIEMCMKSAAAARNSPPAYYERSNSGSWSRLRTKKCHSVILGSSRGASVWLTAAEQRTLEQRMQKRQVKEFMGAFGGLVEHCFISCVDDFTSKAVSSRESGCINRCVTKWMATQQRVSERFQETNAQLTAQMQNQQ